MRHYNIIVTGKVQGVFYRQSSHKVALQLGIAGFVRNEVNGDVYIEAEGEEGALKKFLDWCKAGPPKAVVREVKYAEGEPVNFTSFEIRR